MAAPVRQIFRIAKQVCQCQKLQCLGRVNVEPAVTARVSLVRTISTSHAVYTGEPVGAKEIKKRMETLTDKFTEAREMLDDARESLGTVYFSEDMEEAQTAVNETLEEYRQFLESLSDKQKQEVISTIGLRMEELKAQKAAIEETH